MDWILLVVALLGALDALYFVLVTYKLMAPDAAIVPKVCRMDDQSCGSIVDTRWARVLGLPNAVYGLAWYLLVAVVAVTGVPTWLHWPMVAAAGATVLLSILLFWSLVFRMKVRCPLCFLGHALNIAIFVMLL